MPLSVLMFGWEFPPHNSGGLGTACEGLTRALDARGARVIFVLPKRVGVKADFVRFRFADLERVKFRTVPGLLYPYLTSEAYVRERAAAGAGAIYGAGLLDEVWAYAARARAIAATEKFDIIHAHDWLAFPAGLAAKAMSGKPLIVHVHATEFDRTGGNGVNQEVYAIEQAGLRGADAIYAVSQWTKNILIERYGVVPEKIRVVHNGVAENSPAALPGVLTEVKQAGFKIVLFVGRITLQKGPDCFVQLAKRVLAEAPKTYFVMAGSGDMEGQVMRAVATFGLSDRFIFPGFLRGEELARLYRAADVYVLPSVSEPFGITPLEALQHGAPVIVSKQSGVAEVLRHALKVDFWDIEEMSNQLLAVLRYPALGETLAENGRREAAGVTWDLAAAKCLAGYRELAAV